MTLLEDFTAQILAFVRAQDGERLAAWLRVTNAPPHYARLADELRAQFRARDSAGLDRALERLLPDDGDDGRVAPWAGFVTFVRDYLLFWRNVDFGDLVGAHALLTGLVK